MSSQPNEPATRLRPAARTRPARLWRLCLKELRETLRDRRTLVTLVLMPLLVYPLLSMALNRFLLSAGGEAAETEYVIGVPDQRTGDRLRSWLNDPRSEPPEPILESSGGAQAEFRIVITEGQSPRRALEQNRIDVAAEIERPEQGPPRVVFTAYRGDSASQAARRVLVERLQWLRLRDAQQVVRRVIPQYLAPVEVTAADAGTAATPSMLGTVVPLVLVLMTITGAVYPAIDLTAGERERGTMEALMASPAPRMHLLWAKYTAVVTVALLTAVANLLAMFVTLWAGRLLPLLTGGETGFPWAAVLQILGLLVLFSSFFSAVLLSLTSFAKSFKEAQAYLIPVMLLSLAPAMASLMPGITLSGPLAIAPLINIVLLARDVLSGTIEPVGAVAAVLSTLGYAGAALSIAGKLFGSDAVTRSGERSIGSLFRRPPQPSDEPSPQTAALMLALLVPIYFVTSNGLMRFLEHFRDSLSVGHQLLLNAAALAVTFGLVPLIAAYLGRHRYRSTFRLTRPRPLSLVGAVVIALGAWALAHEAFVIAEAFGIGGLSDERIEQTLHVLESWKQVPPWLLVATLALAPAVIEELCFRGFLFSSLLRVLSPARTILLTSLLFGLFHVLTGSALLVERFVPSTLLGLFLGWIAWRTGSVLPGMVMHLVHNALLELVGRYHEQLEFLGADFRDQTHLPATWLITATAITLLGLAIVGWATRRSRAHSTAASELHRAPR